MTADRCHPAEQARMVTRRRHTPRLKALGLAGPSLATALDDVPTDPADVADCWTGRARMAHARRIAGLTLDPVDLEAIRRHPDFEPITPRRPTP